MNTKILMLAVAGSALFAMATPSLAATHVQPAPMGSYYNPNGTDRVAAPEPAWQIRAASEQAEAQATAANGGGGAR